MYQCIVGERLVVAGQGISVRNALCLLNAFFRMLKETGSGFVNCARLAACMYDLGTRGYDEKTQLGLIIF